MYLFILVSMRNEWVFVFEMLLWTEICTDQCVCPVGPFTCCNFWNVYAYLMCQRMLGNCNIVYLCIVEGKKSLWIIVPNLTKRSLWVFMISLARTIRILYLKLLVIFGCCQSSTKDLITLMIKISSIWFKNSWL